MGQYASNFLVPEDEAVSKVTHPSKPNWITSHAIAAELSIAEVERLWVRFQQMGCNEDGDLTEEAIRKSSYSTDVFVRNILRKFEAASTKKITFENFLRALRWVEGAELEEKVRGIFYLLNNGNPVNTDLMTKILERVYPDDKGEPVKRIVTLFFQRMDKRNKGEINEDEFTQGVMSLPTSVLEGILQFQVLPDEMKERLHQNLKEFRTESAIATGWGSTSARAQSRLTPGRAKQVPSDSALRAVAEKIHRKDWPRVANKLDFYGEDTEDIQNAYSGSQQQAYQMLKQWKERDGKMAYNEILEKALYDCNMKDAAAVLTKY